MDALYSSRYLLGQECSAPQGPVNLLNPAQTAPAGIWLAQAARLILCFLASSSTDSLSSSNVLSPSKASTEIPAARQVSTESAPRHGMSKRKSCLSLATL